MENPSPEAMKKAADNLEQRGPEGLDTFPLNPSRSRYLEPSVKETLIRDIELINLRGFTNNLRHLVTRCSVRDLIQNNQVPTLLLAGKFDQTFIPSIEVIGKTMPHLEIAIFEAGHAVNIDAAEQFNKAVREFLQRFLA